MANSNIKKAADHQHKQAQAQEHQEQQAAIREYRQSPIFQTRTYDTIRSTAVMVVLSMIGLIPTTLLTVLFLGPTWFWAILPTVFYVPASLLVLFIIKPQTPGRLRLGAWILIVVGLPYDASFQYLEGSSTVTVLNYTLIIILSALLGLFAFDLLIVSGLCIVTASSMIIAQSLLHLYNPILDVSNLPLIQIAGIIVVFSMTASGVVKLVRSLYLSLISAEKRANQYHETSQMLSQTNSFGRQVSTSLSSIVSQLGASSRQQATGAQEQAAAVMEVTSSLSELGETARQIATNAARVSTSSSTSLENATGVQASTRRATKTAERGKSAVASSIEAIEEVRNGITGLAERLMILTDRSKQISSIIALIKEISDETHLLALNAAIESAGAGEYGRRFNVVASQVKSLADRSLEATGEVSQVIYELQGAVAAAVLASEETRKRTFGAVERGYQAGQVISELGQVVAETSTNTSQIVDSMQQVTQLAEEISLATQQQESASRQIIETMQAVGMVAQETADAVGQVSDTVGRIDHLSNQLNQALLNESHNSLQLAPA